MTQAAAPFSDGTPQASQWPIPPSHFFDYRLDLKDATAGTYFYHSHVGFQAVSVSGPLIIEDEGDSECPHRYDDERTVFIADVFRTTDNEIEAGLTASPFQWSGETDALLFNGMGVSKTYPNTPGTGCGVARISVEPGRTYRFRFIGATALSFLSLGIEGHSNLQIIEADGDFTQAHGVSFLQIGSGQRYSVLIKTKSCEELKEDGKLQYYLQGETRERPNMTAGYALLSYTNKCDFTPEYNLNDSVPSTSPMSLPPTQTDWLEHALQPLQRNDFPQPSEVTRRVTITVEQIVSAHITWQENMYSWLGSPVPYLVALYEDQKNFLPDYQYALEHKGIDDRVGAFPAKLGEVLEIVIQNTGSTVGGLDVHPFHAHGAHYYDIGSGNGTYDADANNALLGDRQPVKRDTTMLYRYGNETTPGALAGWRGKHC